VSHPHQCSEEQGPCAQRPIRLYKRLRVWSALAVIVLITAALLDFRHDFHHTIGQFLASVQFVPAAMALGTGALVSGIAAIAILLITLLLGRVYCSVLCPLGIFQDLVSRLMRLLRRRGKPLPYSSRVTWLRQLALWSVLVAIVAGWGGFALALLDPYSNYGRIVSSLFRPLLTLANNAVVGVANAVGIDGLYRVSFPWPAIGALIIPSLFLSVVVVMSALRGRLYCNTVCPVGTLLGWVARHAAFRLVIDKDACTKCASCFRACKAQCIDLRHGEIDFDRCVACYDCVRVCDERGIRYRFMWGRSRGDTDGAASAPADKPVSGCDCEGVRDPGRRSLLTRSASALALGAGFSTLSEGAESRTGGKNAKRSPVVAPPGAQSVDRFLERCTACQLCISACPSRVLQPALFEYGLKGMLKPRLDFDAFYCDYDCRRCAEVCPDGAITLLDLADKQLAQVGIAHLHLGRCIVKAQGTDCAACSEHCPTKAVYTVPFGDNLRLPQVNPELCIGCGACEYACPVRPSKAITVTGLSVHGRAKKAVEELPAQRKPLESDFPF